MAEFQFPYRGLYRGGSYRRQPADTTPYCDNVRPFGNEDGRFRGGQRPGLAKAFNSQLASGAPVLRMLAVNTIYVTPD